MTAAPSSAERPSDDLLPKNWDPAAHESEIYRSWVEGEYFVADPTSDKPAFSIVIPPPNVNGSLHMGHAFEHVLMDALSRRRRMQGYEVLWLPGMDHAAIAMQAMVERTLAAEGVTRDELGREAFIDRVWQARDEIGGTIGEQMRKLGDSVDWTRERFTMDDGLSRAVQTVFKQMYDDGLIYRAERLVNWSPVLKTAISDIEVSYDEVEGELVSFRYGSLDDAEPHIVVATTRLETMLGDTAIAVHPDDERYRHLVGTTLAHPFLDRKIPVIADDYVDPEFGSGAVKITPAHDPNDFAIGQRHGLEMPTIMDASAVIADTGTAFDGLDRLDARVAVREALAEQGRIVAEKRPYLHSVGHSERSGEPIEPRLSMQWWVRVESLAAAAGDAVRNGETVIHPESMEPRWSAWVDNMHDWCISRQLWWGHRIPVWYGPDGDVVCVGPDEEPPAGYTQDDDVLDTWFSSGLWPFSTMGWPEHTPELEKFYPTSVLVTGYDILFFWVARMMMFGTYVGPSLAPGQQVPFRDLFLHGLVRDQYGRKMSKSKGNGIDPLDWVDRFGADALRFTLARGANPGTDLSVGDDHAQSSRNFATKLFNATRFALMNGARVGELPDATDLTDADRWILSRLHEVIEVADAGFETYEFAKACEALFHFAWDEFCDWYLELSKVQYAAGDAQRTETTSLVVGHVLDALLRMLHPVMPFVTEELWRALTGEPSVTVAAWPVADTSHADPGAVQRIEDVQRLIKEIRRFRGDQGLQDRQRVAARLVGIDDAGLGELRASVDALAFLTPAGGEFAATADLEVRVGVAAGDPHTIDVQIDTSGTVDLEAERRRLAKDLAVNEKELTQTSGKLNNEQFLAKAPAAVVDKIRARQELASAEVERLRAKIAELGEG
ncbi:valine--tRNA ligase [Williamsia sterculiae]|uniref:Valine--tRNA ligase n=1 Tax=Williamsia sterculiae TaxID=1344003 RepID=A0A1N7GJV7_9NOCA|nr:valine--tRNA ligase [Williamsia sterculiae]SIS12819.1 valyl-tRNA synthetase [Williamsia sterculiae]